MNEQTQRDERNERDAQEMLAEIAQYRVELDQLSAEAREAVVRVAGTHGAHFFLQTEESGREMWDAMRDLQQKVDQLAAKGDQIQTRLAFYGDSLLTVRSEWAKDVESLRLLRAYVENQQQRGQ